MNIGIVKDEIFLEHVTEDYHPENPNRLRHIYRMLDDIDQEGIVPVPLRVATHDEIAMNHDMHYIEAIAATEGKSHRMLDPDTSTSPKSYEAACKAVGGLLNLIDVIIADELKSGFALIRPPGHHAEKDRAMGFCIFNNIAVGARYLEKKYGFKRILIVDFDLHHGNGTQHSFYRDSSVLYFSTHQYPYYPGTGWLDEIGEGEGTGYTVNIPFSYGMGDDDYVYVFREMLVPLADLYEPEIVLVSAGFDTYYNDPLGGMVVTEGGFALMTKTILEIAKKHCSERAVFVLEGGYDLQGLASSVRAVISEMKGEPIPLPESRKNLSGETPKIVERVKQTLIPCWSGL